MNYSENNRNDRRDRKNAKKYKPVKSGLPKGFTKAQWYAMKHGGSADQSSQRSA